MIWRASHAVQFTWFMCLYPSLFSPFFFLCHFFSPASRRGVLVGGGNVRVSGFEAGLAVFICTHRVVLGSFRLSSLHLLSSCLFSVLVRTAGCLSSFPSLALVEASCHVVGFFFSSLAIHLCSCSVVFVL